MERLTTEDFKKIFDNIKVDGFSYDHESQRMDLPYGGWNIDNSSIWNNPSWTHLFYPLLITKIIEGINKEYYTKGSKIKPIGIRFMPKGFTVFHRVLGWEQDFDLEYDYLVDQVKVKVIKHILEII